MKLVKVNKKSLELGNKRWKQLGVSPRKVKITKSLETYGGVFKY